MSEYESGRGGSVTERGQHLSREGVPGDGGQRKVRRDSMLGREPVPPSRVDGDINTESE